MKDFKNYLLESLNSNQLWILKHAIENSDMLDGDDVHINNSIQYLKQSIYFRGFLEILDKKGLSRLRERLFNIKDPVQKNHITALYKLFKGGSEDGIITGSELIKKLGEDGSMGLEDLLIDQFKERGENFNNYRNDIGYLLNILSTEKYLVKGKPMGPCEVLLRLLISDSYDNSDTKSDIYYKGGEIEVKFLNNQQNMNSENDVKVNSDTCLFGTSSTIKDLDVNSYLLYFLANNFKTGENNKIDENRVIDIIGDHNKEELGKRFTWQAKIKNGFIDEYQEVRDKNPDKDEDFIIKKTTRIIKDNLEKVEKSIMNTFNNYLNGKDEIIFYSSSENDILNSRIILLNSENLKDWDTFTEFLRENGIDIYGISSGHFRFTTKNSRY